ncbi:MAG: nucleotidyltransferase domain-containing protein [Bacillota bacterium]|jgi:predicted nucleotidyltransferase
MGYRTPDSASRAMLLNSELNRVVEILKTRGVEKVILFGQLVDGRVGSTGDIDLIIVENTDRRFLDRLGDVYSAVQPRVATDLLVYTPDEIERLVEESSFVREAVLRGRVVYEKNS